MPWPLACFHVAECLFGAFTRHSDLCWYSPKIWKTFFFLKTNSANMLIPVFRYSSPVIPVTLYLTLFFFFYCLRNISSLRVQRDSTGQRSCSAEIEYMQLSYNHVEKTHDLIGWTLTTTTLLTTTTTTHVWQMFTRQSNANLSSKSWWRFNEHTV